MRHPMINKYLGYACYGLSASIAWANISLSAKGLAHPNPTQLEDWLLGLGMAAIELGISGVLAIPPLWPSLVSSLDRVIDRVCDLSPKYRIVGVVLLAVFATTLIGGSFWCWKWDLSTTAVAVCGQERCEGIKSFKVLALVFSPDILLAVAGLLTIAADVGGEHWNEIQSRLTQRRGGNQTRIQGPQL